VGESGGLLVNDEGDRKYERRVIGRRLREVREEQGLTLEQVGQEITIYPRQLEALEEGNYEALPSPLWARGFLIMYANHLGLEGEQFAQKLFPVRHPSWPKRYLKRHWRVLLAALGTIAVTTMMAMATIFAPYNAVTGWVEDVLQEVAPDTFLGSEPQRIVILGFTASQTNGGDNVLVAKVAEDGLGLLSIPRNTLTEIPGYGQGEIGDAFTMGGAALTRRTVARLTGTEVQYYYLIGPEGIREIVDSTGGVLIDVPRPVSGRTFPGGPTLALSPGPKKLNGDQALVYLQGKDLPNDAERAERQQQFLYLMFRQALAPSNLLTNPSTLNTVSENVETNMSSVQMVQLAGRVRKLKDSGAPLKTGTVPGREEMASAQRADAPVYNWVPDARKLPDVLDETVR